jgi:hypothetical protein
MPRISARCGPVIVRDNCVDKCNGVAVESRSPGLSLSRLFKLPASLQGWR